MFEGLNAGDLGAVGIFVILVLREVRHLVEAHWGGARVFGAGTAYEGTGGEASRAARGKVHEMHKVVTREGPDGVPLVYRHPETDALLKTIAQNTQEANEHLAAIRRVTRSGV